MNINRWGLMGVNIQWYDEDEKIILIRYGEHWTWEEFHDAAETSRQWAEQTPYERVDIIAYMESGFVPGKITRLVSSDNAVRNPARNVGLIVLVTTNNLINMLATVTVRVIPSTRFKYRLASTIQQAERIIWLDRS